MSADGSDAALETEVDLAVVLSSAGLTAVSRSVWLVVGQTTRSYGWKLHLSSVQVQAPALLEAVLPILRRSGVPFKIAASQTILGLLNEGALGHTQVGKFMTVYPPSPEDAVSLARELIAATLALFGPKVVSDRYLGGVVYARFGAFSPQMRRNRLGLYTEETAGEHAVESAAAAYAVPYSPPAGMEDPFAGFEATTNRPLDAVARPGPIGPGYLVTGRLATHVKGSVYEALDLRHQDSIQTVVLKEGVPHCMSDAHGRAMTERIANQALAHQVAAAAGVAPASFPVFEHGGRLYLPMEHVPGRDLGARPAAPFAALPLTDRTEVLRELAGTARALVGLHSAGVIHRDLSMRNIRVRPDGTIALLDLEIAHVIGQGDSTRPLMQGTPGFVSPQQLAGAPPSVTDDVFALGAVLICALTGLDPQRVIFAQAGQDTAARTDQIAALSGAPRGLCQIAALCVSTDPQERPALPDVARAAEQALVQPTAPPGRTTSSPVEAARLTALVGEGARWLIHGAARHDTSGMWKSPEIEAGGHADIRLVNAFRVYRSANVGVAGVVYLLAKLQRHGFSVAGSAETVLPAADWLLDHRETPDDQLPGLHFGEAGVALALAESLACGFLPTGHWVRPYFSEVFDAPIDWPDLTHGAAGQGLSALACLPLLPADTDLAQRAVTCMSRCAAWLCDTQAPDGSWVLPEGVAEMSGKAYTGFAHGAAGILAFLSQPAVQAAEPRAVGAAARCAAWLLDQSRAGQGGVYLWWHLSPEEPASWAWWCHGAPGIAKGLLAHHAATGDPLAAAAARAALRSQPFEARHANLGQCHGLAGLGELYIDAFEALGEEEWRDRAHAVARVLMALARREPSGATWLVENPYVPTPDLMIGTAGVVHFLARLARETPGFAAPLWPA